MKRYQVLYYNGFDTNNQPIIKAHDITAPSWDQAVQTAHEFLTRYDYQIHNLVSAESLVVLNPLEQDIGKRMVTLNQNVEAIANDLNITPKTVTFRLGMIKRKLGVLANCDIAVYFDMQLSRKLEV